MNDDIDFELDLIAQLAGKHKCFSNVIISPLQKTPSGTFIGMRYRNWSKEMELLSRVEKDLFVDTTNGCCFLVPKAVFEAIGKNDEIQCPH